MIIRHPRSWITQVFFCLCFLAIPASAMILCRYEFFPQGINVMRFDRWTGNTDLCHDNLPCLSLEHYESDMAKAMKAQNLTKEEILKGIGR